MPRATVGPASAVMTSAAASAAVIDVMELLDALRLKGLQDYEDAVATAVARMLDTGVPLSNVFDLLSGPGVGITARKALEFTAFMKSGEYKTAAAAAASVVRAC